jgi:hypothetical protein
MNLLQISSLIISVISLAVATIALISTSGTKRLKNEFFVGKSGGNLEEFIVKQNQKINELTGHADLMEASVRDLRELQKISVQKMSVIRYNPFKDDGGNLSFSLALLDGKDNGLVITSMHGREQNRIYAKPIKNGKSDFTLTEEEQQAIKESKNF